MPLYGSLALVAGLFLAVAGNAQAAVATASCDQARAVPVHGHPTACLTTRGGRHTSPATVGNARVSSAPTTIAHKIPSGCASCPLVRTCYPA